MPRFIGKYITDNSSKFIDDALSNGLLKSRRGWYNSDWYSKTFQPKYNNVSNILDKFLTKNNSNGKTVRCLDLTDQDMSDSPLKRFHQVIICGNSTEPISGDTKDNLIGGYNNTQDYVITAQLPDSFSYRIGGSWSTPLKSITETFGQYNGLVSAATGGQNSTAFGLATYSVWEAPEPLGVKLTLQCIDDIASGTQQNTLEAIDLISRWTLPYQVNKWGMYSGIPGPGIPPISIKYNSPANKGAEDTLKAQVSNQKDKTRLSVLIGGMLFMDNCILKHVDIEYPNTKAQYLHDYHVATFTQNSSTSDAGIRLLPIRCNITLEFETIIGLTQTNFRNMLALRENHNLDYLSEIDMKPIQEMLGETVGGAVGSGLDLINSGVKSISNMSAS